MVTIQYAGLGTTGHMAMFSELLEGRRSNLVLDINSVSGNKLRQVDALESCDQFISSATSEAAYGNGYSLFGKMRNVSSMLPEQFENLDDKSSVKGVDRRLQPYVRSQLFVALIAELEDFLSQTLTKVLEAYPLKVEDQEFSLKEILELGTFEAVITQAARAELTKLFYASPREYRKRIENILSMESDTLDSLWPMFTEMKARRDVGLHNQWQRNEIYDDKVAQAGGVLPSTLFLGISETYFTDSLRTAKALIEAIRLHCGSKFEVNKT